MVTTDTLEGTIDGTLSYHYDVAKDVLYLRLLAHMDVPTLGEESDDGLIELRSEHTGELVGLTIVNWWRRFGSGGFPDSLQQIQDRILPLAQRIAA